MTGWLLDFRRRYPFDVRVATLAVTLVCLGLVMIYSSSHLVAASRFGDSSLFLKRQALRAVLGLLLMGLVIMVDYHRLSRLALPGLAGAAGLLLLVLVGAGTSTRGATRWLEVANVTLQPSEAARLALVMFLAAWVAARGGNMTSFRRDFLPPVAALLVIGGLVAAQPNFGTSFALVLIGFLVLFLGRARVDHLAAMALLGTAVAAAAIRWVPRVGSRWRHFVEPGLDPAGAGWQAAQSKITLGSGGLIGAGPGAGWAKLEFLPDVHTDFIFASLGEELGFVGASIVLLLFLLLILRGLRIAHRAPDPLGTALAGGISTMFFVYTALHVAVVTGLFPVTGLPLPFVSYGGSALVVNLVATGILLNVSCAAARSRAGRPGRKGGA